MAYRITEACTGCDRCVDVCPISAISPGEPIYVIDDTCCDFQECLAECPENAIVRIEDVMPAGRPDIQQFEMEKSRSAQ